MNLDPTWVGIFSEAIGAVAVVMILGLSPRFKHRAVVFRAAGYEGWAALGLFGAALALAYVLLPWQGLNSLVPLSLAELWPRFTTALVGAGAALLALRVRRQPLASILLAKGGLGPGFQMGLALVFLSIFLRAKIRVLFAGIDAEQVTALFVWLGTAAGQEILLRGFVQTRLMGWLGKTPGWLLTAALSAVWMLPLWLPGGSLAGVLLFAGVAFLQALLLGWMARRTGHLLAGVLFLTVSSWLWMI